MIYFPVWYISFLGHTLIYLTLNVFIWTLCTPHKIHVHERKTRWLMIDARSWEDKKIREISTNKCIIMNRIFCKILWFVYICCSGMISLDSYFCSLLNWPRFLLPSAQSWENLHFPRKVHYQNTIIFIYIWYSILMNSCTLRYIPLILQWNIW